MLLLCLLAVPGSAWECTFENHPDDLFNTNPDVVDNAYLQSRSGNTYLYIDVEDAWEYVNFNQSFSDYLCYTLHVSYEYTYIRSCYHTLLIKNSNDITIGTVNFPKFEGATKNRIELIRVGTNSYSVYVNGVSSSSISITPDEVIDHIEFGGKESSSEADLRIDDITTDDYIILGFDSPYDAASTRIITYGNIPNENFVYNLSIFNSAGEIIHTTSMPSTVGELSVTLPSAGNYKARVMGYNSTASPRVNYIFYSKDLILEGMEETDSVVEFDKDSYSKGEMARISTHFSPYSSGYRMMFVYGDKYIENSITQEDQSFPMVIPLNIATNYVFAYIVDSSGDVLAYDQAEIEGITPDPVLKLDKSSYSPSDSIQVQYWYIPVGTKLTATYYLNGVKKQSSTITINSVSGTEHFTIGGRDADSVTITAQSDTKVYASVSADIYFGNYYVSGKVFDMITGATVSDAIVSTTAFTVSTDENGAYNHSVTPGQIYVTIAADGYEDLHTSMYLTSPSTVKNFYIVPEYTSGDSSVFGTVVDFYNGAGIQGALVKIQQNGTTYTAMTSKKGYFLIDVPGMSGSWKMTVSKTGYESYSKTITLSGDTYEDVSLVPVGGATADPDSSGDSGSPGSSDSTDRPSREAAKDSLTWLETTMPNLIKLAVVVFMLALIGWRF